MFDGNVADYVDQREELRAVLDGAGVQLAGVYTGGNFICADILNDELTRVREAARVAAVFGAESLVVGGGAQRAAGTTDAAYQALAAALDEVTAIVKAEGLVACYHPHLTTIVENPAELAG